MIGLPTIVSASTSVGSASTCTHELADQLVDAASGRRSVSCASDPGFIIT